MLTPTRCKAFVIGYFTRIYLEYIQQIHYKGIFSYDTRIQIINRLANQRLCKSPSEQKTMNANKKQ